jgi:hypothetical protein
VVDREGIEHQPGMLLEPAKVVLDSRDASAAKLDRAGLCAADFEIKECLFGISETPLKVSLSPFALRGRGNRGLMLPSPHGGSLP